MLARLFHKPDFGVLIIRIFLGGSYIFIHGLPKILGGPLRWQRIGSVAKYFNIDFYPAVWGFLAACTELVCGTFIVLGLFFRPASAFLMILMGIAAYSQIHSGDPVSKIAYPIELGCILLGLIFLGPGRFSLDKERNITT
ncbi:MAG TPA: DoxX family protein [Ignavibacteriaceae bacterium]|nr:DoxX family protein [Ignavibacteriaceae bacterium]